ncbi:response regulator [Mucilaginibacter panaciglaebae]|uniref:Response regulatory domain-containing protein n=1 Tax=Mucilaginibacter panaciglaebae TaxID=502331 RepID=A0ABP7WSM2_9SPHI
MITAEKNKRVLVVDDDNDILDIMEEILTYEGYGVSSLDDTDDIFSEINRNRPDLIILDYILKGINGGEICHQIKTNPNTSDIPVILISAYPRVFGSLSNYGCNAFIAKPFDLNDITGRITELISISQNASSC